MAVTSVTSFLYEEAPNLSTFVVYGLALAIATLYAYNVYTWYRLSHIPGPFLNSITGFAMVRTSLSGGLYQEMAKLAEAYGPLVRVGPNEVMFSDADTLRQLSAVRSDFVHGPWYKAARVSPGEDHLFSMVDDEKRKSLKAKLAPGYSGRELGGFEPAVDRNLASLIRLIEENYLSTPGDFRPMELSQKSSFFTLDVISEVGFGAPFGFLKENRDLYQYLQSSTALWFIGGIIVNVPVLIELMLRWPMNLMMPKAGDSVGLGGLMGFAQSIVNSRLAPGAQPENDILQSHIKNGLSRQELIQEVHMETIAGSDTTASAIRMIFLCLLSTPSVYAFLVKEIDANIDAGKISSPIRDEEAKVLPYLQAVIKEGLRFYPAASPMLYKQVPRGGEIVNGYLLPTGTQVGTNLLSIMRSKAIFGPDADVFRPERWIEEKDPDKLKVMHATWDLSFGYGKFYCLGRTLAMMELGKIFVEVLRRYDLALARPDKPLKLWSGLLWLVQDYWLNFSHRDSDPFITVQIFEDFSPDGHVCDQCGSSSGGIDDGEWRVVDILGARPGGGASYCDNRKLKVAGLFKFYLGPIRVYFAKGGKNVEALYRKSAGISSNRFLLMAFEHLDGFSKDDLAKFANDPSGRLPKPNQGCEDLPPEKRYWARMHSISHATLIRTESVAYLGKIFSRYFGAALAREPLGEWHTIGLYEFLQQEVGKSACITLCGELVLQLEPNYIDRFWEYDSIAFKVMAGLPWWLDPKPTRIRDSWNRLNQGIAKKLIQSFDWDSPAAKAEWEPEIGSLFMRTQLAWAIEAKFSLQTIGGMYGGAVFGINANSIPAAGWAMFELIKNPDLYQATREEVQIAIHTDKETGERTLDIEKLLSLPLLQSIYVESLRLNVCANITREVVEPVELNGYKLKKGSLLQAPTMLAHYDDQLWSKHGHTASEFWPERHIKEVKKVDEATGEVTVEREFALAARPSEFFPYGGGESMCAGRFFAKREIMITIAMIVSRFDVEFIEWTDMAGSKSDRGPLHDPKYFGAAAVPPDREMKVRWKRLW